MQDTTKHVNPGLVAERSQVFGQPWSLADEMLIQDITGQMECFMTWTEEPYWDQDFQAYGGNVGAISFETRKNDLVKKFKTHAMNATQSRVMTLESMASNIKRMYVYRTGGSVPETYMNIMCMYIMQAAFDAINRKYHAMPAAVKKACKFIPKLTRKHRAKKITDLKTKLDELKANGTDFMNAATDAAVRMLQHLKKTYGWNAVIPRATRMQCAQENRQWRPWTTEGGAYTFARLLRKTYTLDGNFWDSDPTSTWKVRSPVDPRVRPALIAGTDILSPPRHLGSVSGRIPPDVPTDFSRSRSVSVRRGGDADDEATVIEETPPPIVPQFLAATPQEVAARAAVPVHAIVDDSSASSVDDSGLPDVSGL